MRLASAPPASPGGGVTARGPVLPSPWVVIAVGTAALLSVPVVAVLASLSDELRDLADRLVTASCSQIIRDTRQPVDRVRGLVAKLREEFENAGLKKST